MVNYVTNTLVGKGVNGIAATVNAATEGQFVIVDGTGAVVDTAAKAQAAEAIKVGMATGKTISYRVNGGIQNTKEIKWSHIIKKADIKSYHYTPYQVDSEDVVTFDFAKAVAAAANEDIRVVVRLTFKDLPTRFRKWTESYEVLVDANMKAKVDGSNPLVKLIVDEFVNIINVRDGKRARVIASNSSNALIVTAMPYSDDNTVDSISPANKMRFNGNAWYTRPNADNFESKNKYTAAVIRKTAGVNSTTGWKLVRDAEAWAMGYDGILNRGDGTWPIIKPGMNVQKNQKYAAITLEFENMYRAADDIQRRTKNCLLVFDVATSAAADALNTATDSKVALKTILDAFVQGEHAATYKNFGTKDVEK